MKNKLMDMTGRKLPRITEKHDKESEFDSYNMDSIAMDIANTIKDMDADTYSYELNMTFKRGSLLSTSYCVYKHDINNPRKTIDRRCGKKNLLTTIEQKRISDILDTHRTVAEQLAASNQNIEVRPASISVYYGKEGTIDERQYLSIDIFTRGTTRLTSVANIGGYRIDPTHISRLLNHANKILIETYPHIKKHLTHAVEKGSYSFKVDGAQVNINVGGDGRGHINIVHHDNENDKQLKIEIDYRILPRR